MVRSTLFATVLLAAMPVLAEPELLSPASTPFQEHLTTRVQVGGHVLMGVIATAEDKLPAEIGLAGGKLSLTEPPSSPVCVQVATQDGRYAATNTYGAGNTRALAWPTAYATTLATIPLREIAALATVGPCSGPKTAVTPMEIGPAAVASRFIYVLVNSQGAATWAALRDPVAGGPALRRVRCLRLEEGSRVAFDVRCPLGSFPGASPLELRIEQQGRDGLSMELAERVTLNSGSSRQP